MQVNVAFLLHVVKNGVFLYHFSPYSSSHQKHSLFICKCKSFCIGKSASDSWVENPTPSMLPGREVSSLHTLSPLPSAVNHGPSMAAQAEGEQEVIKILKECCSHLSVLSLLRFSVFHLKNLQFPTGDTGGKVLTT